jgi:hypothetical protein
VRHWLGRCSPPASSRIYIGHHHDNCIALARVAGDGASWDPMSKKELARRGAKYAQARDLGILSLPEQLRGVFASEWDAVVERAFAAKTIDFDGDGNLRLLKAIARTFALADRESDLERDEHGHWLAHPHSRPEHPIRGRTQSPADRVRTSCRAISRRECPSICRPAARRSSKRRRPEGARASLPTCRPVAGGAKESAR